MIEVGVIMDAEKGLSARILKWAVNAIDAGAQVIAVERLKGSTSSTLHRVTLMIGKNRKEVVIRQFDNREWLEEEPDLVLHEAGSLMKADQAALPTPEIIAYDEKGIECGMPVVMMSKVEGAVELKPQDMKAWSAGLAVALTKIHTVEASDFKWEYFTYNDVPALQVPGWSSVPNVWEKIIAWVQGARPASRECFIHRDYHPANVLWKHGEVSGVVDWVNACRGPAGIDIGHCRINLALLYDVDTADEFLTAYQKAASEGFIYDPYWDLISIIDMLFGPPEVYPGWEAFGVTGLTNQMMEVRMDAYAVSLWERVKDRK